MLGFLTEEELIEARTILNQYESLRPDVVTLAMLASLARRIEPELLRSLRLTLSDRLSAELHLTVSTEATLWFSIFIESRGPDNITLLPEFSQLLRERLRSNKELLDAAYKIVRDCHQFISPVIRWEEELVYLSLREDMVVFEKNIWHAIKSIFKEDRPNLVEWIVEMGNRLPETANLNSLFAQLRNICTAKILQRESRSSTWVAPRNNSGLDFSNIPQFILDVMKDGNNFRIGYLSGSGQFGIRVPNIQPIIISVLQTEGSNNITSSLAILPGRSIDVPVTSSPTLIRTIEGHVYSLDQKFFVRNDINEILQQKIKLNPDKVLRGHSGQIWGIVVSPDNNLAISGSYDNTVRLWDLQSWASLRIYYGHTDRVFGVAISPDGQSAVSCSADGTIRVWDLGSDKGCIAILRGHIKGVYCVAITPDGQQIISGSFDKTIRIWNLKTHQCVSILEGHTDSIFGVAVAPDGRYAVSASADKTLRIWDLHTAQCIRTLEGHTAPVDCVEIIRDGKLIISGSRDNTVRMWDFESSKEIGSLEGHSSSIARLAVTSDGRLALTSSLDKTVRIWDLRSKTCVLSFTSNNCLTSIAITSDGNRVIFGSNDNSIWIWNLPAMLKIRNNLASVYEILEFRSNEITDALNDLAGIQQLSIATELIKCLDESDVTMINNLTEQNSKEEQIAIMAKIALNHASDEDFQSRVKAATKKVLDEHIAYLRTRGNDKQKAEIYRILADIE